MKATLIILISVTLFSCSPSRKLHGKWKMTSHLKNNREVLLQIDKKEYTFKINGKVTNKIGYKYENNTIISDVRTIVKDRDTIEVIQIKKDTLILNLHEKGQSQKRTFTRIE
ncbi:MAG: hypothetical protein WEA99_00525 [Brumimicrobium sp.]